MRGGGRLALLALVDRCRPSRRARPRPTTSPIDLRTIGQGYQVRRFAADGSNELLSRRRLTQYIDLNVFDLAPARWHGDDGERNVLYFDASLRFDSDFGGYMLGRPGGSDEIRELKQSQLDILYAFLGGRNVGGRVDFSSGGRSTSTWSTSSPIDGADAIVRVTRNFAVEAFAGTEVRGELPLSAPIYELDGTSAGSRDPATRPTQNRDAAAAGRRGDRGRRDGGPLTARLAYRRVWSATADQQPGEPDSGVNDEKLSLTAMASWRNRALRGGRRALQPAAGRIRRRAADGQAADGRPPVVDAGAHLPGADLRRRFDLERVRERRLPRPARGLRDRRSVPR